MAMHTNNGLNDRQTIENWFVQGYTWSSFLAFVQVDTIAQDCVYSQDISTD